MSLLDGQIQKSALPQHLKVTVKEIVKKRWEYAHSDIHSASFCLDPEFWHLNLNQEVAALPLSNCTKCFFLSCNLFGRQSLQNLQRLRIDF